jgi:AcrR family transcriptional regulator
VAAPVVIADEGIAVAEVTERLGVSPATLYRELPEGLDEVDQYHQLTRKKGRLADFFLRSPLHDSGLVIERDQDLGRV